MNSTTRRPGKGRQSPEDTSGRLDAVVAHAQQERVARGHGYREQALALYPWVCARCGRSFTRSNVQELTVHHKNGDHDHNPADGSNWELLCIYCHDNEHRRFEDHRAGADQDTSSRREATASHQPFANLKDLLERDR